MANWRLNALKNVDYDAYEKGWEKAFGKKKTKKKKKKNSGK